MVCATWCWAAQTHKTRRASHKGMAHVAAHSHLLTTIANFAIPHVATMLSPIRVRLPCVRRMDKSATAHKKLLSGVY